MWYHWFMRKKTSKTHAENNLLRRAKVGGTVGSPATKSGSSTVAFPTASRRSSRLGKMLSGPCGASVTLVYEHEDPDQRLELYAGPRDFSD